MNDQPLAKLSRKSRENTRKGRKVRYALVGAGHIAQNAVLPAFHNARRNSELTAIISDDPRKRAALGRMYKIKNLFGYDDFDEACHSGLFDAVYIALPNSLHAGCTRRAAAAHVHVLCEKPMAVTSKECRSMIQSAHAHGVRLMIAYRLHFEAANLKAVKLARDGTLGDLRFFSSVFSMQVRERNIRVEGELGGGPLLDIGIYCINAARAVFGQEPTEVLAAAVPGTDERFQEVDEAVSAILRFPGQKLAAFTCSFGASDVSQYQVVGTKADLRLDPAYEYEGGLALHLTRNGKTKKTAFKKRDQFAPELLYFSECILKDVEPEPGGLEGLKDVCIIEAIQQSAERGQAIALAPLPADPLPHPKQEEYRPSPPKKRLIHVERAHA